MLNAINCIACAVKVCEICIPDGLLDGGKKNQVTHAQQMRKRAHIFINLAPLWQESFAGYHMSHIKCTNTGKPVSFRLCFNIYYPLRYIYNSESVLSMYMHTFLIFLSLTAGLTRKIVTICGFLEMSCCTLFLTS